MIPQAEKISLRALPQLMSFYFKARLFFAVPLKEELKTNHNENQRMARTMKKAFALLKQKLFFYSSSKQHFLKNVFSFSFLFVFFL